MAVLALSGCAQITDIHDRSLIYGLGIDVGPGSGMVTVTSQAMHPAEDGGGRGGGGGTSGGGNKGTWKTLSAPGSTVSGALQRLQAATDRQVYLGQLAILFLGTPLARRGTLRDLDALMRSPQVAETLPLVVTTGKAASFLKEGTKEQVAWRVRNFVTKTRADLAILPNPLWHFVSQSTDLGAASYAPLIAPDPSGEALRFMGTAVFVAGRMVDVLSLEETTALAWIIKRDDFGGVTLDNGPNAFHVVIRQVRARWDMSDPAAPRLRMFATGDVANAPASAPTATVTTRQAAVAREMREELLKVLRRLQGDGADVVGVGERLRERGKLPPGPWGRHFADLHFQVSVQVRLISGKLR